MSTLRVLHCSAGNLHGGVETVLSTLARHRALNPRLEPEFALSFEGRSEPPSALPGKRPSTSWAPRASAGPGPSGARADAWAGSWPRGRSTSSSATAAGRTCCSPPRPGATADRSSTGCTTWPKGRTGSTARPRGPRPTSPSSTAAAPPRSSPASSPARPARSSITPSHPLPWTRPKPARPSAPRWRRRPTRRSSSSRAAWSRWKGHTLLLSAPRPPA